MASQMLNTNAQREYIERIRAGLEAASNLLSQFVPGKIKSEYKAGGELVTQADRLVSNKLRKVLVRDNEGWLSEEDTHDDDGTANKIVWVVDPVDGTQEFVSGIPEWCISIGLVVEGEAVAGGICNPATREVFL